jgi:DNA-binding transcriptional MocR family regulator
LGVPTYHNIFPIAEHLKVGVAPLAMTEKGPDLNSLESAVRDRSVRLIYTMPNYQNPTAVTYDEAHRQGIHSIAIRANLPVLEDDFETDLFLEEDPLPPIKALDKDGRVIYLGTFSKSLFPGMRIGWLVASPRTIQALTALKKATDLEGSTLLQAAACAFCRQGHFDRHLARIRELIRERMDAAMEALKKEMPEEARWSRPKGGYALWVRLPEGVSSERIFEEGRKQGILISPGTLFSRRGDDPGGIRLSLTLTDLTQIRKGIVVLGRVIREEMGTMKERRGFIQKTGQHL